MCVKRCKLQVTQRRHALGNLTHIAFPQGKTAGSIARGRAQAAECEAVALTRRGKQLVPECIHMARNRCEVDRQAWAFNSGSRHSRRRICQQRGRFPRQECVHFAWGRVLRGEAAQAAQVFLSAGRWRSRSSRALLGSRA